MVLALTIIPEITINHTLFEKIKTAISNISFISRTLQMTDVFVNTS